MSELVRLRVGLGEDLVALGLRVLPSVTNFLLCEVGPRAHAIEAALLSRGLVVRKYPAESPLSEYLRFTIRTEAAHRRLVHALDELLRT